jgi:hypothetical protein
MIVRDISRRAVLTAAVALTAIIAAVTLGASGATAKSPVASAAARHDLFTRADRVSFDKLQQSLTGVSGVAVSGLGKGQPVVALGSLKSPIAWSTSKVPVAMAVIAAGGKSKYAGDLRQAITASDNAAAERLWSSLGSATKAASAANAQLRAAGDSATQYQSRRLRPGFTAFGQTVWSLANQARFTAGMSCVAAGRPVLDLMGQVISAHRWGLGVRSGAKIKGGWGPGTKPGVNGGYVDRQMGVVGDSREDTDRGFRRSCRMHVDGGIRGYRRCEGMRLGGRLSGHGRLAHIVPVRA